jgi:diguanylate cyclase (GGDEF)-like protein
MDARRFDARRLDDRALRVLMAGAETGESTRIELQELQLNGGYKVQPPRQKLPTDGEESVLLLDVGQDEFLVVAGAEVRYISNSLERSELMRQLAEDASEWRRERLRKERRLALPDLLMAYAEALNHAKSTAHVFGALMDHACHIVAGNSTVVFHREGSANGAMRMVEHPRFPGANLELSAGAPARLPWPGVVSASEVMSRASELSPELAPLFELTGAVSLMYAPVGSEGMLFVVERRSERAPSEEDRELMQNIVRQACVALERIHLFEEVEALSLTDPLTGLPNRRKLQVVLEHSLALARRGEPITLVMIDIDDFKTVNDDQGHLIGDEVLRKVAKVLEAEVRASDLAVRWGGDEFLLVLPGGSADGAKILLRRIRESLGATKISAGIAVYGSGGETSDALLASADREMLRDKRSRKAGR